MTSEYKSDFWAQTVLISPNSPKSKVLATKMYVPGSLWLLNASMVIH